MIENDKSYRTTEFAKYDFDLLLPLNRCDLKVRRATEEDLADVCQLGNNNIPNSSLDSYLVWDIICRNADSIFVFEKNGIIIGGYAMLMLTPIGLERLLLGEFDGANPDFMCLAKTGESPAAQYLWGIVGPGVAIDGIRHISQFLQQPKYQNINLFVRPVTDAGVRLMSSLGYEPIETAGGGLYRYIRLVNRDPKLQRAA